MRWKSQVRFGGRRRGDHRPKSRHRRLAADPARAGAPSGAPGLLLCQKTGVSLCAPGRRPSLQHPARVPDGAGHRDTSTGGSCGTPGAGASGKGAHTRRSARKVFPLRHATLGRPGRILRAIRGGAAAARTRRCGRAHSRIAAPIPKGSCAASDPPDVRLRDSSALGRRIRLQRRAGRPACWAERGSKRGARKRWKRRMRCSVVGVSPVALSKRRRS
jgi:hypothetical protein